MTDTDEIEEKISKEMFDLFVQMENEANEETHQKFKDFSFHLSNLTIAEKLIDNCIESNHLLYMCLMMIRDILKQRGFLLSEDEMLEQFTGLFQKGIELIDVIKRQDILNIKLAQCLAILFRLINYFSSQDPFDVIKENIKNEDESPIFCLIVMNETIQNLYDIMPHETKKEYDQRKTFFVQRYFDDYFEIGITNLSKFPVFVLNLFQSILTFPISWEKNSRMLITVKNDILKITDVLLPYITDNEELSDIAANCLNAIYERMKFDMKVERAKIEFSNEILRIVGALCQASNPNNNVSVANCIYNAAILNPRKLLEQNSFDLLTELSELTKVAIENCDAAVVFTKFWALLANECQFLTKEKSKRYRRDSDDDEDEDSGDGKSFIATLYSLFSSVFGSIFSFLFNLSDENDNFENFLQSGNNFIDSFKDLWSISYYDFENCVQVFLDQMSEISCVEQTCVSALLSCSLLENYCWYTNNKVQQKDFVRFCGNTFHALFDVIEGFEPENVSCEDELERLLSVLYDASQFMIDYIVVSQSMSKANIRNLTEYVYKTYNYKLHERVYHVLLNLCLRSLHVFSEFSNIVNCIDMIAIFQDTQKSGIKSLMMSNEMLQEHANGGTTPTFDELELEDRKYVFNKYYEMINRAMQRDTMADFLCHMHEELLSLDSGNVSQCLVTLHMLIGSLNREEPICIDFLTDEEHKCKFLELIANCGENTVIYSSVCSLFAIANERFERILFLKESGLVFVHIVMDMLSALGDTQDCNDKMAAALLLIFRVMKNQICHFYAMRYFNDDLLTSFCDIFFDILARWPREEIEQNHEWLHMIVETLLCFVNEDKELMRVDNRLFVALSFVSMALLQRGYNSDAIFSSGISLLNSIIEFSDGTLGPLTAPFVIVIEDIMNHNPIETERKLSDLCRPVKMMIEVARNDCADICGVIIESYEEKYRGEVEEVINLLFDENQDRFDSNFQEFSRKIRKYQVPLSTLPQFIDIFRQTSE